MPMIPMFKKKISCFLANWFVGALGVCLFYSSLCFADWIQDFGDSGRLTAAGEGQVDLGLKIPSREPKGTSGKAKYNLTYSSDYWALSGGGEDYIEPNAADNHSKTFAFSLHLLRERSLHRLSFGAFQLSPLWQELYDIPHEYRLVYGHSDKAIVYELIHLNGVQLSLAAVQRADKEQELMIQKRPGAVTKLAWQWPGQESSRFGAGWELGTDGKYEGLSILFQNQGFKNQVFSGEWIRKKRLANSFLLSNILSSDSGFESKAILAITNKSLWQISLERWTRLWNNLGWSLIFDLKRAPGEGSKIGTAFGIEGKL
ncbi:MAG: hypothetical protein WCI18_07615 [Pseudomonadota bacterium]